MRVTDPATDAVERKSHRRPKPMPLDLGEGDAAAETKQHVSQTPQPSLSTEVTQYAPPDFQTDEVAGRPPPKRRRPQSSPPREPPPQASKGPLIAVGLIAIVLGIVGGMVIAKQLPADQKPTLGRLSISADRPAEVLLGNQSFGQTPLLEVLLPVGKHHLVLKEENGAKHAVDVTVSAAQETKVEVVLDSLPLAN